MKFISLLLLSGTLAATGCASAPQLARLPEIPEAVSPAPGIVSGGRFGSSDISRVQAAGIRHVIDLTPDAETPEFDEAAAVREAGMRYTNLPLRGAVDLTRANVHAFDKLIRNSELPVLVHCASGNRVGAMAALTAAWVDGQKTGEAVAIGKAWGLKSLEGEVRRLLGEDAHSEP